MIRENLIEKLNQAGFEIYADKPASEIAKEILETSTFYENMLNARKALCDYANQKIGIETKFERPFVKKDDSFEIDVIDLGSAFGQSIQKQGYDSILTYTKKEEQELEPLLKKRNYHEFVYLNLHSLFTDWLQEPTQNQENPLRKTERFYGINGVLFEAGLKTETKQIIQYILQNEEQDEIIFAAQDTNEKPYLNLLIVIKKGYIPQMLADSGKIRCRFLNEEEYLRLLQIGNVHVHNLMSKGQALFNEQEFKKYREQVYPMELAFSKVSESRKRIVEKTFYDTGLKLLSELHSERSLGIRIRKLEEAVKNLALAYEHFHRPNLRTTYALVKNPETQLEKSLKEITELREQYDELLYTTSPEKIEETVISIFSTIRKYLNSDKKYKKLRLFVTRKFTPEVQKQEKKERKESKKPAKQSDILANKKENLEQKNKDTDLTGADLFSINPKNKKKPRR
ncbi:hypothetical protein B6U93_00375 [Candidatus Woesearchaeota archaeon ex4484_78]|nr:MAG: hypothetical protein B6U93_00375 [Candidatus Woesearchaeota archaeon ex4484_78]